MKTRTPSVDAGACNFAAGAIFAFLPDGYVLCDADGIVLYINPAATGLFKRTKGFACNIGDKITDLLSGHHKLPASQIWNNLSSGNQIEQEISIPMAGSYLHLHVTYSPICQQPGSLQGICVVLKELPGKKFEPLKLSAGHSATHFMEYSPVPSWITDEHSVIRYMNPAYKERFGFSADQCGKNMFELFSKPVATTYHLHNLQVLRENRELQVIEKVETGDGGSIIYKVFKFPVSIDDIRMVAGCALEITEQVRLQEQLTESIERYHYVNEATSDAIYDWDVSGNRIFHGTGFETLFGQNQRTVSIRHRLRHIHPDDLQRARNAFFSALRDESSNNWTVEYRFRTAEGDYRHVIDKAFIRRADGRATRVIGAIQDITSQKSLQLQLIRHEKSRKREIVRSIIEAQEKERRQLSVELHDNVNQILSSCKLMLEVACDNGPNAAELTRKSFESLQTVITEIRKISHDLNPSAIDDLGLVEAIQEMVEKINLSGKLGIQFTYDESDYRKCLKPEDKIAIYRILQEQLSNILKHAAANKVMIHIRILKEKLLLTIEDDGVGFDLAKARRGLGLRNIHNRVEYYHGTLNVFTAPGKGCRMQIVLDISPKPE